MLAFNIAFLSLAVYFFEFTWKYNTAIMKSDLFNLSLPIIILLNLSLIGAWAVGYRRNNGYSNPQRKQKNNPIHDNFPQVTYPQTNFYQQQNYPQNPNPAPNQNLNPSTVTNNAMRFYKCGYQDCGQFFPRPIEVLVVSKDTTKHMIHLCPICKREL